MITQGLKLEFVLQLHNLGSEKILELQICVRNLSNAFSETREMPKAGSDAERARHLLCFTGSQVPEQNVGPERESIHIFRRGGKDFPRFDQGGTAGLSFARRLDPKKKSLTASSHF